MTHWWFRILHTIRISRGCLLRTAVGMNSPASTPVMCACASRPILHSSGSQRVFRDSTDTRILSQESVSYRRIFWSVLCACLRPYVTGIVGESQVGCPCLYLQELTDRALAARLGSPARPLGDPASSLSVPCQAPSRRDSTGEGLKLLAVTNVQGVIAGSAIIFWTWVFSA